ncbi:MAG TPA: response regulator transcription factor, partial [Candidatus Xenobia bacterium]
RMMGLRKEDRYQTAAEVDQALRQCMPTGSVEVARMGRARVLVIDDDPVVLGVIEGALESTYQVLQACNGQEGLETALQMQPDLIISDMEMPIMDGMALCAKLRANAVTSEIPFIMLTSYTDVGHEERGLEAGADDYVGKPIEAHRLLARVKALLRRSQRRMKSN